MPIRIYKFCWSNVYLNSIPFVHWAQCSSQKKYSHFFKIKSSFHLMANSMPKDQQDESRQQSIAITKETNVKDPDIHQLVIIGSGPAAHTAAIYAARATLKPILYEGFLAGGVAAGGQLTTTTEVENFPGFPHGITGTDLMENCRQQSLRFGTKVYTETISKCDLTQHPFQLWTEAMVESKSPPIKTHTVIIATGATAKRLHIAGEDTYWQKGISACAVCDGAAPLFRNKPLAVIGGGDSACEEATFLTKYASKVYLLVRRDQLRASQIMAHRAKTHPKIEILWNTAAVQAKGEKLLTSLVLKDTVTKQDKGDLDVKGLFYAIGHEPNTGIFLDAATKKYSLECDADGYLLCRRDHPHGYTTMTSIEGVFACGDVQDKRYRQAITAAGSGCRAAMDVEKYLEAKEATA